MPRWDPRPEWSGEDAYVLGGGDSLRHFSWDLIRGQPTIGCNSNFILGHEIVEIAIFGDILWWERIGRLGTTDARILDKLEGDRLYHARYGLQAFGGRVVGTTPRLYNNTCPWLLTMARHGTAGLASPGTGALAWAGNTGCAAVNLALTLGARRVYLLGFDMHLGKSNGKSNWHDVRYEADKASVYQKFCREFEHISRTLPIVFPGREIWNVTDDSNLNVFPKVSLAEHFAQRK